MFHRSTIHVIMASLNPIYVFDITLKAEKISKDDLKAWCIKHAKKWVFQLEKGESGYEHWQIRVSLKEKTRNIIPSLPIKEGHASPTSTAGSKGFTYVMKDETRIEGPFTDRDEPLYIPARFRDVNLKEWQRICLQEITEMSQRKIMLLQEPDGNMGKSFFAQYLKFRHNWIKLPPTLTTANDFMRAVMNLIGERRVVPGIVCDIPRSVSKKHLWSIAQALEALKDGECYDERYGYKSWDFEPCPIVVCTNWQPDNEIFSHDRWMYFHPWNDEPLPDYIVRARERNAFTIHDM